MLSQRNHWLNTYLHTWSVHPIIPNVDGCGLWRKYWQWQINLWICHQDRDWSYQLGQQIAEYSHSITTEAKFMASILAGMEIIWLWNLFDEFGSKLKGPSHLHIDNQSTLSVMKKNPKHHGKMKHLDLRYFWLREVTQKITQVRYVPTNSMPSGSAHEGSTPGSSWCNNFILDYMQWKLDIWIIWLIETRWLSEHWGGKCEWVSQPAYTQFPAHSACLSERWRAWMPISTRIQF